MELRAGMWAVMFTDMVGSTDQRANLGDAVGDTLRREHDEIVAGALHAHNGELVKGTGDGVMCAFASAADALSCAITIQQQIERRNRDGDPLIGLRIGVSAGDLAYEASDLHGLAANEAARVCALAGSGQILVSDLVRAMAGSRAACPFVDRGVVELKGIPQPVTIWEVQWEPLHASAGTIPIPGRLRATPWVGVVGRDAELAVLLDAFKRAANGDRRQVVLVSGEAGLGKTTVVAEAARRASAEGACVLYGHCEEDLATPYQLFGEALAHYAASAPDQRLRGELGPFGSELVQLVPALAHRVPDLAPSRATDAETERYLLFAAVVGFLASVSAGRTVVLVLDDLQWADKASLQLLRHLAAAEQEMRLLVLGTYRARELSKTHPLVETLSALHRQQDVSQVELKGLDDAAVVSFLEAAAGHALDDNGLGLAHALYRETDGNPFFVSELLRHLSETGAIFQDADGHWTSEASFDQLALPDSVRMVIGARVGRLGPEAERVLSVAAVIGRDFDLELLARATGAGEDDLLDILDAAVAASLIRETSEIPGGYSFAHALIQHTLYEDLGATRRARVHRRIGAELEVVCGDDPGARVGELARHWIAATQPVDLDKAISYARQAGDAALRALAPADALRYYLQTLGLASKASEPDPVLLLDLTIGVGSAQRMTGDPAFRDTLLDASRRAAELHDTERLVRAVLANYRGWVSSFGVIDDEKIEMLELALGEVRPEESDRASLLATLCAELVIGSPLERRQALAEEALSIARNSGSDEVLVRVLNSVATPLLVPPLVAQSLSWTAEALEQAIEIGDPILLFWTSWARSQAAGVAADLPEADRCIDIRQTLVEQLDQPALTWQHTFTRGWRALIAGDARRAEQLTNEALEIGMDSGQADAATIYGGQLASVMLQLGTMGDLAPVIAEVAANPRLPGFKAALVMAHAEGDRLDEARAVLDEFAADDFAVTMDFVWLTTMTCCAEGAIECRDQDYAAALFERLEPWAGLFSTTGATAEGPVDHYLGALATVLGRHDDAERHFHAASELNERTAGKFFGARTNLAWGRMLLERGEPGDRERARELFTRAHAAAMQEGYGTIERRSGAALFDLS